MSINTEDQKEIPAGNGARRNRVLRGRGPLLIGLLVVAVVAAATVVGSRALGDGGIDADAVLGSGASAAAAPAHGQAPTQARPGVDVPALAPGDDVFDERTLTKQGVYSCHIRGVHHPVDSSFLPDEYQMSIKCFDIAPGVAIQGGFKAQAFINAYADLLTTNTLNTTTTTSWQASHGQPALWIWEGTFTDDETTKYSDDRATCLMIKENFHSDPYIFIEHDTRIVLLCSALRAGLKARAVTDSGETTWWVTHNSEPAWSDILDGTYEDSTLELAPA